ncbi:MAG: hypothetical protein ACE366_07660 [Bradymonadia bacterium]
MARNTFTWLMCLSLMAPLWGCDDEEEGGDTGGAGGAVAGSGGEAGGEAGAGGAVAGSGGDVGGSGGAVAGAGGDVGGSGGAVGGSGGEPGGAGGAVGGAGGEPGGAGGAVGGSGGEPGGAGGGMGGAGGVPGGAGGAGGEPGGAGGGMGGAGGGGMCEDIPVFSPEDPMYDRYEGTGANNACRQDADCMPSGCSGEVCAAEPVASTCEAIAPAGGACGCVEGQCIWHTNECGGGCDDADGDGTCNDADSDCNADGTPLMCRRVAPECPPGTVPEITNGCYTDRCVTWAECGGDPGPVACAPVVEGEFGLCDAILGWAPSGVAGQCIQVSGCGCDEGCEGRVFETEASCQRACGGGVDPGGQMCGGFAGLECPDGQQCIDDPNDDCDPRNGGADCAGICVEGPAMCSPIRPGEYGDCRAVIGYGIGLNGQCQAISGCGCDETCEGRVFENAADCERACVDPLPPQMCGGFAGFECPEGLICVDDPNDECDPAQGGADCIGICVEDDSPAPNQCAAVQPGEFGLCEAVLGWGINPRTGTCSVVSGCGCDERCDGRVFEDQASCRENCELR